MKTAVVVLISILLSFLALTPAPADISREHVTKTGPSERLHENPPANIASRTEAIVDAIWAQDYDAFLEAAVSPDTLEPGYVANDEKHFKEIVKAFRTFYRGDLRTMRHPPKWPSPDAERVWVRVSVERQNSSTVRGQFILIFDPHSWALERVTLNRYHHADLPDPEPEFHNDIIRDRPAPAQ
jgi:hypothetical protein